MPLPVESVTCDFSFGSFRLSKDQRQLLDGATPVRLGSRAFDLLTALIERAGEIVSRRDLEARAWPGTIVEETSLRVHMSSLRRAIGDGVDGARYIENVPGRGYCFVATVVRGDAVDAALPAVTRRRAALPRTSRMIGRAGALATLKEPDRELVLLVAWEGLTIAEAAAALGCTRAAAAVRLHRARKRLHHALTGPAELAALTPVEDR